MSYVKAEHRDCIQIVIAFPDVIDEFEHWLALRGCRLFQIPVDENDADDLPTYAITMIGGKS